MPPVFLLDMGQHQISKDPNLNIECVVPTMQRSLPFLYSLPIRGIARRFFAPRKQSECPVWVTLSRSPPNRGRSLARRLCRKTRISTLLTIQEAIGGPDENSVRDLVSGGSAACGHCRRLAVTLTCAGGVRRKKSRFLTVQFLSFSTQSVDSGHPTRGRQE